MDNILNRFYIVAEVFRDDERLMSVAINQHCITKDSKCSIYKDLLNCRYHKWIDQLEEISHLITDEWIEYKLFVLDNGHDKVFLKGDMNMIESMCYSEDEGGTND